MFLPLAHNHSEEILGPINHFRRDPGTNPRNPLVLLDTPRLCGAQLDLSMHAWQSPHEEHLTSEQFGGTVVGPPAADVYPCSHESNHRVMDIFCIFCCPFCLREGRRKQPEPQPAAVPPQHRPGEGRRAHEQGEAGVKKSNEKFKLISTPPC